LFYISFSFFVLFFSFEFYSEEIQRPGMLLKLRTSSLKAYQNSNMAHLNHQTNTTNNNSNNNHSHQPSFMADLTGRGNLYSPIKCDASQNDLDKMSEPFLTTTASVSTTSYDLWMDSCCNSHHIAANSHANSNRIEDDAMLKSMSNDDGEESSSGRKSLLNNHAYVHDDESKYDYSLRSGWFEFAHLN